MNAVQSLPYRLGVGIMLANPAGQVFVGQRIDWPGDAWQMPQGGLDPGEDWESAALRELEEETGVASRHVHILHRTPEVLSYDLPEDVRAKIWKGRFRGQQQHWYLMRFLGQDADVNIATRHAEFSRWRWASPETLPDLIVPFKRELYRAVLAELLPHL